MSLVRIASFLIVKHSCVREEFIDLPFFLQTQLQQITVKDMKKLVRNHQKIAKKNDPKNRNGKILRTFGPYIF